MDFSRLRPVNAGHVETVGANKRVYLSARPQHLMIKRVREQLLTRLLRGRKLPFTLPVGKVPPIEWLSHEDILSLCAPYEVISFDVFDTLLLRRAGRPGSVFRLLEMQRGQLDFDKARRQAEIDARKAHPGEITLDMIYEQLAHSGVIDDAARGAAAEIDAEIAMTKASPRMLALVRDLIAQGKRVVAVSDMYLPASAMERMLQAAGYPALERVFVSCDVGERKAEGKLHTYVKEALGTANILHIGDNVMADVDGANQAGLDAAWLCHMQEPDTLAAVPPSPSLASAVWRAQVNQRLNGGVALPDAAYGVGYAVTGILAWGYCQWLHEQKKLRGWDKLLFAARDGWPLYQLYTQYFGKAEYLPISRASAQMLDFSTNAASYVDNNLYSRVGTGEMLIDALTGLGLAPCAEKWRGDIDLNQTITADTLPALKALMIRDRARVEACFAEAKASAERYFRALFDGVKTAAVADTGWKGSSTVSLQRFLREIGVETRLETALLGTSKSDSVQYQQDAGRLVSYLYGPGFNRHIYKRQFRRRCAVACSLMEMLFVTDQPPLLSYAGEHGEKFTYGEKDAQAGKLAASQFAGMMDFAADYHGTMEALGFLPPVSPDDAYAPFDALTRRGDLLLRVWGDYRHTAAPTARKGEGTVAAMLRQAKWVSGREYARWIHERHDL